MRPRSRPLFLALAAASLAAAASVAGCGDGVDVVRPLGEEGLSFRYTGRISGEYHSEGTPALSGSGVPAFGDWAFARADSVGGMLMVGFQPTTAPKGNLFILQTTTRGAGELACAWLASPCHGRFITGVNTQDLSAKPDDWYEVVQGRVTLAEVSGARVRGTFTLRLVNIAGNDTISVTGGVIDLPFSTDQSLSNGINCLARNLQNGTNEPCAP
ncbi:MAG TPA: hypothetical protein VF771_11585 [Longimicrobiaceae bacterium]